MRYILAMLLCLSASVCHAGHYTFTFSGGETVMIGPQGVPNPVAYSAIGNSGWGGNGDSRDPPVGGSQGVAGQGSVHCHNTITVTATWVTNGSRNDVPPASIVLIEESTASASGDLSSIQVNNGIGGATTATSDTKTSQSKRYSIKSNPGQSFSFTVTPEAFASLSVIGNNGLLCAHASVDYSVSSVNVTIDAFGALTISQIPHYLPGQEARFQPDIASVYGSLYFDNPTWSSSIGSSTLNGYFKDVLFGQDLGSDSFEYRQTIHVSGTDLAQDSVSWYYDTPGLDTVSVELDIYHYGQFIGRARAERSVVVDGVAYVLLLDKGGNTYSPNAGSPDKVRSGADFPFENGMLATGMVIPPSSFYQAQGYGEMFYCQRVNYDYTQWPIWGVPNHKTLVGRVLDDSFPYEGKHAANYSPFNFTDSPEVIFFSWTNSFDLTFEFNLFLVYEPPIVSGYSVRAVPVHELDWTYESNGSYNTPAWNGPFGSGVESGDSITYPGSTFMDWDDVRIANEI